MKRYLIFLFVLAVVFTACKKTNNPPSTPEIAFIELSPNEVRNSHRKDTLNIQLRYTIDGTQLGNEPLIFFVDSRFDTVINSIPFPPDIEVREDEKDNTVSGTMTLRLEASRFLVMRADTAHIEGDTLNYEIQIMDKDSVRSNKVTTSDVYIIP